MGNITGGGDVALTSSGAVSQTGNITASALSVSTTGAITLASSTNDVTSVSFKTTSGDISYVDANSFSVTTANSVVGVDTDSGSVSLTAKTGDITVDDDVNATTGITLATSGGAGTVTINSGKAVTNTSSGGIAITSDKMAINGAVTASSQTVTLKSTTAGQDIDIGSTVDSTSNTLELSTTELGNLTASAVQIGNTTGTLTMSANLTTSDVIDLTLVADKMDLSSNTISFANGTVTLKAATASTAIDIGGTGSSGFAISDTELNNITTTNLTIGSTSAGAITISSDVSPANVNSLHLISGSTITGTAGGIVVAGLALESVGEINITDETTNVADLAVKATGQEVTFVEKDNINITTVDGVVGVTADTFNLTAGGTVTETQAINATVPSNEDELSLADDINDTIFVQDFTSPSTGTDSGC